MYDSSLKYKWHNKNVLDYAVKEAEHKKSIAIAMELLKEGSSIEFISRVTKLPIEEVQKLVPLPLKN